MMHGQKNIKLCNRTVQVYKTTKPKFRKCQLPKTQRRKL